jgi:ribosomal protein L40E
MAERRFRQRRIKVINSYEERQARKNIYRAYGLYHEYYSSKGKQKNVYTPINFKRSKQYDDIFTDPIVTSKYNNIYENVERVRATFNHVGSLLEAGLIQKEPLMNGLWHTGRVCWICLKDNIVIERDKRNTESYMSSFERFNEMAEQYRIEHNLDDVQPYYKLGVVACKKCGFSNELEFEFCTKCGTSFKKVCSKCGQVYNFDLSFCGKCGTAITP